MHTNIGRHLQSSPGRLGLASLVGVGAAAGDLLIVWSGQRDDARWLLAFVALVVQASLARGDLAGAGIRLGPEQSWGYWGWMTAWIGLAVAACIAVGLGLVVLRGHEVRIHETSPSDLTPALLTACVLAPVLEETNYRLVLCVPLAVSLRPWGAVAASGLLFAALHFAYGNPSPENLAGGFFLAWAFLKSGSITVPVLLHSLGNLVAVGSQVAAGYWGKG